MNTKFFMLVIAVMVYSYSFGQQKKNEIEINSLNFGFSKNGTNVGVAGKYRYFISDKFALYGKFGTNVAYFKNPDQVNYRAISLQLGLGGNYYFTNSEKGFYANASINNNSFITKNNNFNSFSTQIGIGYKLPISNKVYISGEVNHEYNFYQERGKVNGLIGVGIRF
jgi:hypothetical protein